MIAKLVFRLIYVLFFGSLLISSPGCEKDKLKINNSPSVSNLDSSNECRLLEENYILMYSVYSDSGRLLLACTIPDLSRLNNNRIYIPELLELDIYDEKLINHNHYSYAWNYSDQYIGITYNGLKNIIFIYNFPSFHYHYFSINIGTVSEIDIN